MILRLTGIKLLIVDVLNCICKNNRIDRKSSQTFVDQIQIRFNHNKKSVEDLHINSCKLRKNIYFRNLSTDFWINSHGKCYSTSTDNSLKRRSTVNKLSEDNEAFWNIKERQVHVIRIQNNLLQFLDVAVNSNMKTEAFNTLRYYHNTYQNYGIAFDYTRIYNSVLEAFAAEGDWTICEEIIKMMTNGDVKPTLETFIYAIECAYRAEKYNMISEILEKIKLCGFDINHILSECNFVRDQKEVVLKAIRLQIPNFKPIKRTDPQTYNCKLLENLNKNMSPNKVCSHLRLQATAQSLRDFAKEQLQSETRGFKTIKSITANSDLSKEKAEVMRKLKEYELKWKKEMLLCFQDVINATRLRSEQNDGRLDQLPFFCCLKPEDFVDIMYNEFISIMLTADDCVFDVIGMFRRLGNKVMDKYLLQRKMNKGLFDHTMKIYDDYCDYYVNPELVSRYTPRQYWELLKDKYSDGPDIEQPNEYSWSRDTVLSIGKAMFTIMEKVLKLDFNYLENNTKTETTVKSKKLDSPFFTVRARGDDNKYFEIKRNHLAIKYFELLKDDTFTLSAPSLPMLCPPIPWTSVSSGGYLLNHNFSFQNFLRGMKISQHKRLRKTKTQNLFPYFDSLIHIGDCPWIVNKQIFSIVIDIFKTWDINSLQNELSIKNRKIAKLLLGTKRTKQLSDTFILDFTQKLSIANELLEKVFWYPHNVDFRGRVYPISSYFNYQSITTMTDVDRALLLFAEGKPLGVEGLNWLKIHLLNLTKEKKRCSLNERLDYCNEMLPEIMDSADNPLTGNKWWQKSDNPFQTLACCIELTSALRSPAPYDYISHFPVHQDGSSNGLQHYAALGRDAEVADLVNLEPNDVPKDLYHEIAEEIERERKKDAENGDQVAKFLDNCVDREFVKKIMMAMVYASNIRSVFTTIVKRFNEVTDFSDDQQRMAAEYLVEKINPIFEERFSSVLQIRRWFTESANLISHIHEKPVEWITPVGLPVMQPYWKVGLPTVKMINRFRLEKTIPTKESNTLKQAQSFSSNYIHSLDATHFLLTNLFCQKQGLSFVGVHDSFWTHPCSVAEMNKICRETFVALHNQPLLESLSEYLNQEFCSTDHVDFQEELIMLKRVLSDVPSKGLFDLRTILQSTYFFS